MEDDNTYFRSYLNDPLVIETPVANDYVEPTETAEDLDYLKGYL